MIRKLFTASLLCAALTLAGAGCSGSKYAEIKPSELPPAVKSGFEKEYPGATIHKVEKETYRDGLVHYEIEFTDKTGKKQEIEFNEQGEPLEEK